MAAAMLFSVLLPTHDRLEYLRYAVESVRRQDDADWELVVSDNDSTDDIAGYVHGLGDDRVRYVQDRQFVPVTENWNNALRHSRGDYVVMLGDDDALLPGYLSGPCGPSSSASSAPTRSTPGRLPVRLPGGASRRPGRMAPAEPPRVVLRRRPTSRSSADSQARELARAATDFRALYDFNMQYVLVRPTGDPAAQRGQ